MHLVIYDFNFEGNPFKITRKNSSSIKLNDIKNLLLAIKKENPMLLKTATYLRGCYAGGALWCGQRVFSGFPPGRQKVRVEGRRVRIEAAPGWRLRVRLLGLLLGQGALLDDYERLAPAPAAPRRQAGRERLPPHHLSPTARSFCYGTLTWNYTHIFSISK